MDILELDFLYKIHIVSTSLMVGVIWIMQLVHYPSFNFINVEEYKSFQEFHMKRISLIVIPFMIIELTSGVLIFWIYQTDNIFFNISLFCLFFIWFLTAILFSKMHQKLTWGYQISIVTKLVNLNWLRTISWTLRLGLVLLAGW